MDGPPSPLPPIWDPVQNTPPSQLAGALEQRAVAEYDEVRNAPLSPRVVFALWCLLAAVCWLGLTALQFPTSNDLVLAYIVPALPAAAYYSFAKHRLDEGMKVTVATQLGQGDRGLAGAGIFQVLNPPVQEGFIRFYDRFKPREIVFRKNVMFVTFPGDEIAGSSNATLNATVSPTVIAAVQGKIQECIALGVPIVAKSGG